jgi:hypothetical protein
MKLLLLKLQVCRVDLCAAEARGSGQLANTSGFIVCKQDFPSMPLGLAGLQKLIRRPLPLSDHFIPILIG